MCYSVCYPVLKWLVCGGHQEPGAELRQALMALDIDHMCHRVWLVELQETTIIN